MTKVKKITVANLKAVASLTADFNGCTAIITGGNNKGKTSFLRSLPDRIRGIKPDIILKSGESDGLAEWELTTGEKFIWSFDNKTKAGERLQFITKDNIKTSVTRELATRFFPPTFDVDAFLQATPKKQKEALQKLVGLDFTDIDSRYKAAYQERTFANRKAQDESTKTTPVQELPEKESEYFELEKELAGIDAYNDRYSNAEQLQTDLISQKAANDDDIAELERKIAEIKEKNIELSNRIAQGDAWLKNDLNKPKNQSAKDDLQAKIDAIKANNEAIHKNNEAKKQLETARQAEEAAKKADDDVKAIEAERMNMIKSAAMPEGFGFTDDGITYNDLPFTREQLSSSGIYIAALKLASMNLGEVRTLHFDASFLDKNSLADIEKWANDNDLQLLIERPDFEAGDIEYQLINP